MPPSPPPKYPLITYQTEGRTFERVFKERSLRATKAVVRKKLGLGHDALIELVQLRDGEKIDLEDDDDFEAFRAFVNSSLHATVGVTIPLSVNTDGVDTLGEKRRRPNEPTPDIHPQGAAESRASASIPGGPPVQSPSIRVVGSPRPRKRRKVAFACDLVTSESTRPAQPPSSSGNVVEPSSPNPAPAPQSSSKTTKRTKSSTPTINPGKPKSNAAKITHQDDEAIVPSEISRKRGRKKDDLPPKGGEPLPDRGSPEPQVKRVRKKTKKVVAEPETDGQHEQPQEAALVTAEVIDSDMPKRAKTGEQKSRSVKASGAKKPKVGLVDEGVLDSAKSLKRKKKVQPDAEDDIHKTIATLLERRMQSDSRIFLDTVTETELAVRADPPLTDVRKRSRLKTGPGLEENQRPSKLSRTLATQDTVKRDAALAIPAPSKELTTVVLHPTSDHHTTSVQPSKSESGPVRRKKLVHTLEDRSAVRGANSIETEVNVKSRPVASEETTLTSGNASRDRSRTGAKPTIPEGLPISRVPVEAHGEGSSDESSSEDEEAAPLAKPATAVADPPIPMNFFEDQLAALIRGPEKRGPRRSVLDEIPSSSETGSESSPEDLMLDEEEDLSQQPSRKKKTLSKNPLSSIEPESEPTSEDEGGVLSHVFMDTPNEVQTHSATSEVEVASDDADSKRRALEHPGMTEQSLDGRGLDIPGSVQTPSDNRREASAPRATPSESDATVIDTEPPKRLVLASTEQLSGRILVPASSPFVTKALVNTGKKVQTQDEIDDVEPADESTDESDPIEPEPNVPSVDRPTPRLSVDPISSPPLRPTSRTTNPSPDSGRPSRRSGRLADRRFSLANSEATPVSAKQPDRKASLSLLKSAAKEDSERTHDETVDTTREKPARKQVGKGRKSAPQRSTNPEDDTPRSVVHAQAPDGSPAIDQLGTSSLDPVGQLVPVGDDVSRSADIGKNTPMPNRQGVTVASQGKGGGGQPLFFPGSSQPPRFQTAPSPSASESEPENVASALPRKTPTRSTTPGGSTFRSLSGLASQDILFPKSLAAKRAFNNTPSFKMKGPSFEGDNEEDDEESSSSSGDETGSEVPKSHIPKERRAGATPRKKGGRLSSLARY